MDIETQNIEYVAGTAERLQKMPALPAWIPFDKRVIAFFAELSLEIMSDPQAKRFPDLVSLAFWMRENNIKRERAKYTDISERLGRGLVFTIAPGNVPLSFAYSLVTSLFAGDTSVIRLPSRTFEEAVILCGILKNIAANTIYSDVTERFCLIKYAHDKNITDKLSSLCHTRIIYGGDKTVSNIRQSPLPPRANEITFANRFSMCIINADAYLSGYSAKKTARGFYIDTYLTDQNACSSPRILFWYGKNINEAKERFWSALYEELKDYNIAPVTAVDKLDLFCRFAAENKCRLLHGKDYKIVRVETDGIRESMLYNIGNSGFFYECNISCIKQIIPLCTLECQTLSYIGFDAKELRQLVLSYAPFGVDRIVSCGKTMDFGFVWDGVDIMQVLTRKVSLI